MLLTKVKKRTNFSKETSLLLDYKREISKINKHLSLRVSKKLLRELQINQKEIIGCMKKADQLFKKQKKRSTSVLVGVKSVNEMINKIVEFPKNFLLLLSYCSKPIYCPSGRFSEKCRPFANSVCERCPFSEIILKIKKLNSQYFIVTQDHLMFARYLLPRFRNFKKSKKYQPLIATGCSLAINKFYRVAVIFGSIGIGYKFINGSCKDSNEYQKAEAGKKIKVTELNQKDWQEINYILDEVFKKIRQKHKTK